MKNSRKLSLFLVMCIFMSVSSVFAVPSEVDDELYDYSGTYTMTENFEADKSAVATQIGVEEAYSPLLKAKVFQASNLTNVKTENGKLKTLNINDEVGLSFKNAVPGPDEYVINNADRKASYVFDAKFTHNTRQTTAAAVYIGVRTEKSFNSLKNVKNTELSGDGIWLGIGKGRIGIGSPMFTSSAANSWTMQSGFDNTTHFRVYDNVKDNIVSYYTVGENNAETLIATITVGEYDETNDKTPFTYTVWGKDGQVETTINVSGKVSRGGMYYPQLYVCNIKTEIEQMSVTAAKTKEYGLTSLKVNGENADTEQLSYNMDEAEDGKLTLNAQAPYGTHYEIYASDANEESGFKKLTAVDGDNIINVSGVRTVKLKVTNGVEETVYIFNYEAAPSFNKNGLETSFRVIYGTDLAIDLDDYFHDEAGTLEFYINEEHIPGRMISVPTTEPDVYEYTVEARNAETGKSKTGSFTAEVYYTVPKFNSSFSTEIKATVGREKKVDLAPMFSDEISGTLLFSIADDMGETAIADGVWNIDTDDEYEKDYTIKVKNNYSGYSNTQVFKVSVKEEKKFSFNETFDSDASGFSVGAIKQYSQSVSLKVFAATDVSSISVSNGAYRGGINANYSAATRYAVDGTSPYTVDLKFSADNSYGSAGLYFAIRATEQFKQFTTAVSGTSTLLPSNAVWIAVAESKKLSIGFPARQNAVIWKSDHDFSEMTHLRIYDDTLGNVIYYKIVDDETGEESLVAKVEISYTTNNQTKLKYTVYNGDSSTESEFTANGIIPQTGNFYPQLWSHDSRIVLESFGITQKADEQAQPGNVTVEGISLDKAFSNSVYEYTGTFVGNDKYANVKAEAARGINYRVYTDVEKNIHTTEGFNRINLENANFLCIEFDNGYKTTTYKIALSNTPYFKADAKDTLYFEMGKNDSIDLTEYFADNCEGSLEFCSESKKLIFDGQNVSVASDDDEAMFDAEIKVQNQSTGKYIIKKMKVIVFKKAENANAKSLKVFVDERNVTPEIKLSGDSVDIIIESDAQDFKFETELDYFGHCTAVTDTGKTITSGTVYELGKIRKLTITVTNEFFQNTKIVYTINFKPKPIINSEALDAFLSSYEAPDGKKGLLALKDYSLDLRTVFSGTDGEAMASFAVVDENGDSFGVVETNVFSINHSKFEEKTLTFFATSTNGVKVSTEKKVEFFKLNSVPVFTSETLTVSNITDTSADVSWSEAEDENGIVGYNLYYLKSGDTEKTKIALDNTVRSHTITNLSPGKKYNVYVEAVNLYGNINVKKLEKNFTTTGGNDYGGGSHYVSAGNVNVNVPQVNRLKFADLENFPWAEEAIYRLAEKGIVKGVDNENYEPDRNITRAEFVSVLMRALGLSGGETIDFADVEPNAWYAEDVKAAKYFELIFGDGSYFRPDEPISRQDMIVIVCRALEKIRLIDTSKRNNGYPDEAEIAPYAKDSVEKLVGNAIITGDNNGRINPASHSTRAEIAVLIDRIVNLF